ncbi:SNF1-related protein kinase, putative [Leishmania panamensis]|uniref:SNF1-related protein kinase, putative n=1 Tax=Leishmania panamensis TaxID=5679 RepID=A0A088S3U1_LEIPA|nr:SNF1-related protein kinase, putative [Leishmania panamensis]AIO02230.1 SNF1-related protein kinase, putative [Leishmania panamensis]
MANTQRSNAILPKVGQRFGPYQVGETIGRGTFAKVKIGYHETTKVRVALKIISRKLMDSDARSALKIKREIKIMRVLRHPHITRLYDVVKTKHDIVLVMEYVSGGELFDYISRQGRLEEPTVRTLFQQLAAAVAYCHRYRVTHRDIKPENIMMEHGSHSVKLSDFGLSSITHDGRFFETSCGTPNYASPEVVSGRLYGGPEADVWSCGVVLYAMLCGTLPFDESNISVLFKKIQTADYVIPSYISRQAQDLLHHVLVVNPLERATMEQVMQHPWLRPNFPRYLLSLHYAAIVETTRFASTYYLTEDMLDVEVMSVVASRFHASPETVASIIMAEEERIPSMRAVISDEDNPNSMARRYPAANYFEMYSNVLDSKLWPTPVEIAAAEVALRSEAHDIFVSYVILTQKKQSKLAPQEHGTNASFGESANTLLQSQAQQGYGSLNANSLHQRSGNASFTGLSFKETSWRLNAHTTVPSTPTKPKDHNEKTLQHLPPPPPQSTMSSCLLVPPAGDPWQSGYNAVAAPFLPLHANGSTHTVLGHILHVQELPVQLLLSRRITVKPVKRETSFSLSSSPMHQKRSLGFDCVSDPGSASTSMPTVPQGNLLQPQRTHTTRASSCTPKLLHPQSKMEAGLSGSHSQSYNDSPLRGNGADMRHKLAVAGGETALDTLYHAETVTRFGNDFIRNGVAFVNSTSHETLREVYEAMKQEGLLWKVIYDYYFSVVRYPNIKLQVKVYRTTLDEQLVDVKVSAQSGMAAYDVALSLLERLRTRAVNKCNAQVLQNGGSSQKSHMPSIT